MRISFLFTLLISMASAAFGQNWETFGGNSSRNGLSRMTASSSPFSQIWQVQSGLNTTLGMAVYSFGDRFVNSRTVFSPYTSRIECRDLNTGNLNWVSPFISSTSILYAIGMTEDAVYAHDYDTDSVYALNVQDGSIKWKSTFLSHTFGAWPGCVFACNGDPILNGPYGTPSFTMRLDKNTGDLVWSNNDIIAIGPSVPLAASSTTVYRITGGITLPIRLAAIDINSGVTLYNSNPIPGDPDQEDPLILGPDGTIYFWRDGGALFAYTDNGSALVQAWAYSPPAPVTTPLLRNIALGKNNTLYIFENNQVKRLNALNGAVISTLNISLNGSASISVGADSTVYLNDGLSNIYAYSADLQTLKWQRNIPSCIYLNPPLCREGTMVLTQDGTTLYGLRDFLQSRVPVADFRSSTRQTATGQPVDFFDQSSFSPNTWQWQFPGSAQGSSSLQNPAGIVYNIPGVHPVTLTVSNALGEDSISKTCYIEVVNITSNIEPASSDFSIYPNPAMDFFRIRTKTVTGNIAFELIDQQGRTVLHSTMRESEQEIDISNLPSGIYLLRIETYGETVLRMVKS